ncbi:GATA transcription factor 16-like [Gastrolobium bilobum]|uniref:GATA transcription factor 16-like n=1 Tax=Gastrolobium bilobum TaxID=150636 RepID=UPI002AAF6606|nr:GATA transcription factor 16-like [Gastrolobium bilobum]
MVDPSGKGSEAEDANPNGGASSGNSPSNEQKKTCADCGTTKTPLWRGGPAGPKSLCNACGIRSRKKKRAILGISKGSNEDSKKGKRSSGSSKVGGGGDGLSLKQSQRLFAFGREVLMQRSHWKKLGEEEQAAVLLMSLSYGSVYA